jgi:hypothetical protein
MDLLMELEGMAINISAEEEAVSETDAARWQNLFGYTRPEAVRHIEEYRADFSRRKAPDALWDGIKAGKEAQGYDREAYEYSLTRRCPAHSHANPDTDHSGVREEKGTFIVQLSGPLNSADKIREAADMNEAPKVCVGTGESGEAEFCEINAAERRKLLRWISKHHDNFQPTIVRLAKASKSLCRYNMAPMLGVDLTLPQHRPEFETDTPSPRQDQYPVWYFFYGTLCDSEVLTQQLNLQISAASLVPALVEGGQIRTWGGKYKALVEASRENKVSGSAFLVQSREQEDALRFYETDKYEVVRCRILTEDGPLQGLTFRFSGTVDS